MPAPFKQGLDYWPRSVNLNKDPKLREAKMKYGYLSVTVYELLLDILYADKGYYIDYNRKKDVIWTVLEGLQGKYQPTFETIEEIIECLVACELFSGDHFKRKTITSIRAQRTYYSATVDRKMVNINYDIWMLSEDEMRELSSKSVILRNFHNRPINGVNRPINDVIQSINPESKAKKSKVNIKEFVPPTLDEIRQYCLSRKSNVDCQRFYDFFQESGWVDSEGKPVQSWKQKVITWERFENRSPQSNSQSGKSKSGYKGREWDYDKLEKLAEDYLTNSTNADKEELRS